MNMNPKDRELFSIPQAEKNKEGFRSDESQQRKPMNDSHDLQSSCEFAVRLLRAAFGLAPKPAKSLGEHPSPPGEL